MGVLEELAKAAARDLKAAQEAKDAAKLARQRSANLRRKEIAVKIARGKILGEAVRDYTRTDEERRLIGVILSRWPIDKRPGDWEAINDFLPKAPAPAADDDVIEFAPSRPKVAVGK
jgi:hypothetical protein